MSNLSTARKIGIVARVATQQFGRSRTVAAVLSGARATGRSLGRVLHQLWLQVAGFTFLALAAVGALAGLREYAKYQDGRTAGPGRLLLAAGFTVSFAWFGLSSFWRARKRANHQGH